MERKFEEMKNRIAKLCREKGCGYYGLTIQEKLDMTGLSVEDFKFINSEIWKGCKDNKFTLLTLKNMMALYTFSQVYFNYNKILNGRV